MSNTPTTPASVSARLTDEGIERLARWYENHCIEVAAVLRDYVRLRKLLNAVKAKVDAVNAMPSAPLDGCVEHQKINCEKICAKITAFAEIKHLLAEADKGEVK